MVRIEATQLIPGRGAPVPDAVVITDGDTITYAGPAADAPPTPDASTVRAHTVMPGMWDCHTHLMGLYTSELARLPMEPALNVFTGAGFVALRDWRRRRSRPKA